LRSLAVDKQLREHFEIHNTPDNEFSSSECGNISTEVVQASLIV